MMSKLFTPLKVGTSQLEHRMIMAPLTRFRADDAHVPLSFVKEYYGQRASTPGTMIITEGTFISPAASGYPNVPGIWNDEQIAAWKEITGVVHSKKSFIYVQLWSLGRTGNPEFLKSKGQKLIGPSALPFEEGKPVPEEMTEEEIQEFIGNYAQAAKNAMKAGFDGVEVHGANGYLIDQFTQDMSNQRTDKWGGSIEKRARFGVEVTKAVVAAIGADKVGYRISPYSSFQGMRMKDPVPQFSHLLRGLKALDLAYIHIVESRISGSAEVDSGPKIDNFVDIWGKTSPILLAGGYTAKSAQTHIDEEFPDYEVAICFGRYFISNPDLPYRVKENIELTKYERDTFYKACSKDGYVDYPFSKEFLQANL